MINPFDVFSSRNANEAQAQAERNRIHYRTFVHGVNLQKTYHSDGTQTLSVTEEDGLTHTIRLTQDVRHVWFKGQKL